MGNNSRTKGRRIFWIAYSGSRENSRPIWCIICSKKCQFFSKNSLSPRAHTSFQTLISYIKNSSVTFVETSYVYVSKCFLLIGEIKLSSKVARGGVWFSLREKLPFIALRKAETSYLGSQFFIGNRYRQKNKSGPRQGTWRGNETPKITLYKDAALACRMSFEGEHALLLVPLIWVICFLYRNARICCDWLRLQGFCTNNSFCSKINDLICDSEL